MSEERKATMFDFIRYVNNVTCSNGCVFANICCKEGLEDCFDMAMSHKDIVNDGVVKWCDEHPIKTRQSELLKILPDIPLADDGLLAIAPCAFDKKYKEKCDIYACGDDCTECRKEYWGEEI